MRLILEGNSYLYECENLIRLFYPGVDLKTDDGDYVVVSAADKSFVKLQIGGKTLVRESFEAVDEWGLTGLLYDALSQFTGRKNEWGMLTGVRPVKMAYDMIKKGKSEEEIIAAFTGKFKASEEKARLTYRTALNERDILSRSGEKSVSIYAGIPFCPTRCRYCSFVCEGLDTSEKLIEPYIELLCREIEITGEIVKAAGLKVETVYVGGGTPTSVSPRLLDKYLKALNENIGARNTAEFTVEAGRPDTLSEDKLEVMRENGVGRISVNPQTLNDEILKSIGRDHTSEQFFKGFASARETGAFLINVDLIAGLPGESHESFERTVREVIGLSPDNITLHALTLKRAAELYTHKENYSRGAETSSAVSWADREIMKNGYEPYYLYRQKNTVGALENTGFSKPGCECLYNIYIMDETHSILACGAGASSKIVSGRDRIVRSFNYKYPREYINGFAEIEKRKNNMKKEIISALQGG